MAHAVVVKPDRELTPAEKFAKYARKPRGGRPRGARDKEKVVSVERILALRKSGLTYKDVGAIVGKSEEYCQDLCEKHKDLLVDTREFSAHKADIIEAVQRKLVLSIDDKTITHASLRDRVQAISQMEDIIRKERGLDNKRTINIFAMTVKAAYQRSEPTDKIIEMEVCRVGDGDRGG